MFGAGINSDLNDFGFFLFVLLIIGIVCAVVYGAVTLFKKLDENSKNNETSN